MKIPTVDNLVFIIEQSEGRKVYETVYGEQWEITGTCNMCGECEVGSDDPNIVWTGIPVGQPGACYNVLGEARLDNPVRPEIKEACPNCVLEGRYLNAN